MTAPGGGVCTGPKRTRSRHEKKETDGSGGKKEGKGPRIPHWHENLSDEVKASLDAKEIRHETGTVDISSGSVRIKLGTNGYTSAAHADGLLAEGTFESDDAGKITFTWKNALAFEGGKWIASDATSDKFPASLSLGDGESESCIFIYMIDIAPNIVCHANMTYIKYLIRVFDYLA